MFILKFDREINYMRDNVKRAVQVRVVTKKVVKSGVTAIRLDKITERYIRNASAVLAFRGYKGFPSAGYASVDKGILPEEPSLTMLKNGDNINVVRDYVGHSIDRKMHEDPQIPSYGSASRGPRLRSGITLAKEPMINLGTHEVKTLRDE